MNKVSSIKSLKTDSPKTPGGISKSLLTPCRRLGLSRNYKKAGPVPFISPISGNSSPIVEVQTVKKEPRKRKKGIECEENKDENETTLTPTNEEGNDETEDSKPAGAESDELANTPTRHFSVPCKKKSKTLLSALGRSHDDKTPLVEKQPTTETLESIPNACTDKAKQESIVPLKKSRSKRSLPRTSKENTKVDFNNDTFNSNNKQETASEVDVNVTPLQKARVKSNSNVSKNIASQKSPKTSNENRNLKSHKNIKENKEQQASAEENTTYSIKPRSPNDLTKECIVVIQKKIFKTDNDKDNDRNLTAQDSDSDVPLCELNKEKNSKCTEAQISKKDSKQQEKPASNVIEVINLDEEQEDFVETKKKKVKILEDKATSIGGLKKKNKIDKPKPKISKPLPNVTDFDDEDDFDFDNKKTILIRKTYEKVSKLQKARSTGSITQRDIDELKSRIEAKKKLLLARAMTEDTEELRSLIKKWQKGCQDALMELMDLMKTKFPDKQNMDYSEMLSTLQIPTNLVGYDEENDCFNTPDDANAVLSKFNDL